MPEAKTIEEFDAQAKSLTQADSLAPPVALITREREPENLEFPFAALDGFLTPNASFYVRNHFPVPHLDARAWRLQVEGAVKNPLSVSYDELLQMPAETRIVTIECAGNSRVFLAPKVDGVQWEMGAVGNAEWTGVSLSEVLARAGVEEGAIEIVLEGADKGEVKEGAKKTPGAIHFARSIPAAKAREVLLAYRMNGETLSPAHGFPLRAVVAGWYGMASIKWLSRIIVTKEKFNGYFQTLDYAYWEERDGLPAQLRPIGEMQTKALIARPATREVVAANTLYRMRGAAWSGDAEIVRVEISTDGGGSWAEAKLLDEARQYVWRLWEYDWRVPARAGEYTLMARAADSRGRTQPMEREKGRGSYMINHVLPIKVEVR
jgi:DMSO/TMAO reductase YedYZ molybdopterin-dependent catalytic subunit